MPSRQPAADRDPRHGPRGVNSVLLLLPPKVALPVDIRWARVAWAATRRTRDSRLVLCLVRRRHQWSRDGPGHCQDGAKGCPEIDVGAEHHRLPREAGAHLTIGRGERFEVIEAFESMNGGLAARQEPGVG